MIRKHIDNDLDAIMTIWYEASTLAHPFWDSVFVEKVKNDMRTIYIPNSETWVYEENNCVIGFISMIENEIGGLFVLPNNHSKGIGTKLVDFMNTKHKNLDVEVFDKNIIGRAFYDKYGFVKTEEFFHEESNSLVLRLSFKTN